MPLVIVGRPGRPHLYVRGTVCGQRVFESTGTCDRRNAEAYRATREAELFRRSVFGARAVVTFATAAASYLTTEPRSPGQAALVKRLLDHFKTAAIGTIDQDALDQAYRVLLQANAAPATRLRNVLVPLRAILEHAARRGWCNRTAFETPQAPRPRIAFLTPGQATTLVQAAAPHLRALIVFLLTTGARMSEALELEWQHVDLAAARVHLVKTKGRAGGGDRRVDLPAPAIAALSALPHGDGRVFRPARARKRGDRPGNARGEGYADNGRTGGGQIKTGWAVAAGRAGLPGTWHELTRKDRPGKVRVFRPELHPHDLRHTAATWHYAKHKDLLRLQHWGGWSDLSQVQIYAHVIPEHYRDEILAWLAPAEPRQPPSNDAVAIALEA